MLFVSKITSEGSKFRVTREMQRWPINSELFFQQVLRRIKKAYAKNFGVNRPSWTFLDKPHFHKTGPTCNKASISGFGKLVYVEVVHNLRGSLKHD